MSKSPKSSATQPIHLLAVPKGAWVSMDDFSANGSAEEIAGLFQAVGTTDLATIKYRVQDLGADRILYVIGSPQALHLNNGQTLNDKLRDLEHAGDQTTHAIFRQLNTSFVTPFDREDIYNLASDLDDVMDFVEAAADLVILTGLGTLPAEMSQQVALLQRCAQTTAEAMRSMAVT